VVSKYQSAGHVGHRCMRTISSALRQDMFTLVSGSTAIMSTRRCGCLPEQAEFVSFQWEGPLDQHRSGFLVRGRCPVKTEALADSVSDGLPTGRHLRNRVTRD
jgi:hypothetical protein